MSPEAVTQRLRLMGELWELGVKLKNSKIISSDNVETNEPEVVNEVTADEGEPETQARG